MERKTNKKLAKVTFPELNLFLSNGLVIIGKVKFQMTRAVIKLLLSISYRNFAQ